MINPLSRSVTRLGFVDFSKGIAILSIVVFHYMQPFVDGLFAKAIMVGGTAVHLFFLLSGFGLVLGSSNFGLYSFFRKRFYGFLIPYYVYFIFIVFLCWLFNFIIYLDWYAIFGHLFLFKMFDEGIIGSYGYHLWFISTIVQFYLIFPFLQKLQGFLGNGKFLLCSLGVSVSYWFFLAYMNLGHLRVFNSSVLQFLWELALGMVLAEKYRKSDYRFWEQSWLLLLIFSVLGISMMAVMAFFGGVLGKVFNDIPASIGFCAFVALIYKFLKGGVLEAIFVNIGKVSFELYLMHMILFSIVKFAFEYLGFIQFGLASSLFIALPFSLAVVFTFAGLQKVIARKIPQWHA